MPNLVLAPDERLLGGLKGKRSVFGSLACTLDPHTVTTLRRFLDSGLDLKNTSSWILIFRVCISEKGE